MDTDTRARSIEPARVHVKRFHRALGVMLTMACPLECAHCCVESGPSRTESLDADLFVARLHEIGREGRVRQIVISGGEPFAAQGALRAILDVAAVHGIAVLVNTSAYWAVSVERAAEFLRRFPGLTHLCVSADEYHEPFVPLARVGHALRAAIECALVPELSVRVWDTERDPFLDRLHDVLGADLLARTHVTVEAIEPVGRGRALPLPSRAPRRPSTRGWPAGACDLAHQPVVAADGTVLGCCNTRLASRNAPLQLGRLQERSFAEISAAADGDALLQALRVWGPERLAEIAVTRGLAGRLKGVYPSGRICALCDDLLSQPEVVDELRAALGAPELADELTLARLLRYGEMPA